MKAPLRLRILHTNDLHSHFEQMPRIAAVFEELRNELGPASTLTVDIGDHMDRVSPLTEGSGGKANMELIMETGYEAITIGNNEGLTFTAEALHKLYTPLSGVQVLCSNLIELKSGTYPAWGVPYHIVEKNGITIGLIGVTAYYPDFYSLLGWEIQDPHEVTAKLVKLLRDQVDLIIVLSHLGLRQDERMASEIPGIDVILGGHTHHLLEEPLRVGDTAICGAGKFGQYIGVVDLALDDTTRSLVQVQGYVKEVREVPVQDVNGQRIERRVTRRMEEQSLSAKQTLAREVAYLQQSLEADWYREAPLGNLLAQALRKCTGARIGLVNAGQLLEGLEPGAITAGRLLEICPSPINPSRIVLTGQQIRQALEESLLPEFTEKRIYGFGFRGKVLGMLNVDGITVHYDPDGPSYGKIKCIYFDDGELLQPEQDVSVGTIDMFTFGSGYLTLSQGKQVQYLLPEFIRDLIREALNSRQAVQDCQARRWLRRT